MQPARDHAPTTTHVEGFDGEEGQLRTDVARTALAFLGVMTRVGQASDTSLADTGLESFLLLQSLAQRQALAEAALQAQQAADAAAAKAAAADALSKAESRSTVLAQELAQSQQALTLAQSQNGSRGLLWKRYDQGYFADSPAWFTGQVPTASGVTNGWSDISRVTGPTTSGLLPIAQTTQFSFLISGFFVAQRTGSHQFKLSADDAAYLWIGPTQALSTTDTANASISLAGIHGNNSSSVTFDLVVGRAYALTLLYGQSEGGWNLQFSFVPPGGVEGYDGTSCYYSTLPSGTQVADTIVATGLGWYRYDQGYFADDPSWFQGRKASASGTTNGWTDLARASGLTDTSLLPIGQTSRFSFLISGYFVAKTSGSHTFTLSSDDASYLWIGPSALGAAASVRVQNASINLSGLHGNNSSSTNVTLVAGQATPMLIMFGQNEGGWNLSFSFAPPGSASLVDGKGYLYQSSQGFLPQPPADQGVSARFVKLFQPSSGCLHFAEVQVFSHAGGPNVAAGAKATSSSLYAPEFPASNLTDGDLSNFAHTSCNDSGWFLIDLGSLLPVYAIKIFNRVDCCQARENGVVVSLLDEGQSPVFTADPLADRNGGTVFQMNDAVAAAVFDVYPPSKTVASH